MRWHRLQPGELDHETIWLIVSVSAALIGLLWLQSGWATPKCVWHEMTGYPCVGCGSTRVVRHLLHGEWGAAFAMNPLFFSGLVAIALYNLYAATVVFLKLPRLRFTPWPGWAGWTFRGVVVALILANWAWLIINRV